MELSKWSTAESVITIRISKEEYEELDKWVNELNYQNWGTRNKVTISRLARKAIRYCLQHKEELKNILYE